MILTCPACATQYAVKDGAIPPGGRQVRCASCKHSWHQDPEAVSPEEAAVEPVPQAITDNPVPSAEEIAARTAPPEVPPAAAADDGIAGEPQPAPEPEQIEVSPPPPGIVEGDHAPGLDPYAPPAEALEAPSEEYAPALVDHEFVAIPAMHDEEEGRSAGRMIGWIVAIVVLVAAAAAAFWFFAPPEMKTRFGLAEAGASQLELMLTTSDRQQLASGNELLAISGRIINPTDQEQLVPPIRAQLRNKQTKALVYQWTIAAPARSIPPRGATSFNSAEVGIPEGGDELTVTLGGQPS